MWPRRSVMTVSYKSRPSMPSNLSTGKTGMQGTLMHSIHVDSLFTCDCSDEHMDSASIWALVRYHIVMMLASMYMTMVLCSWEVDSPERCVACAFGLLLTCVCLCGSNTLQNFGINKWSMVVKLVSQWVAVALYFWTLFAPMLLTGRKFEFA